MHTLTSLPSRFLLAGALAATAATASAQISYNTANSAYTENFSSYGFSTGTTGSTTTWTNNSTVPGFSAFQGATAFTTLQYAFGGTVSATTNIYGYKFDALGTRSSSTEQKHIILSLTNNTGQTLNSFSLSYSGLIVSYEQDAGPDGYRFSYKVGGTINDYAGYNAVSTLDYNAPVNQADASGNPIASSSISASSIAIAGGWANGTTLFLRWTDHIENSVDSTYGLGIDNISFSAIPEPSAFAALAGLGALGLTATRRRRT